jgi:hypothetical protein
MEGDIASTLIQAGPLGAIILALGFAYWRQGKELGATQDKRVEDAKKVTDTLLDLNDKWNATVTTLTAAVNDLKTAVEARRGR